MPVQQDIHLEKNFFFLLGKREYELISSCLKNTVMSEKKNKYKTLEHPLKNNTCNKLP